MNKYIIYKYIFFSIFIIIFQKTLYSKDKNVLCKQNDNIIVNYHVDYGNTVYKSVDSFPNEIENIDKYHVKGLTDINYKRSYNIKVEIYTKDNIACLKIKSIDIYFGYPKINVLIDNRYSFDSCEYRVIRMHENEHVKIYQSILKKYSQNIGKTIFNRVGNKKPMLLNSVDNIKNKTEEYIQEIKHFITSDKILNNIENDMLREIEYHNNLLDTKENYNKTKKLCENW